MREYTGRCVGGPMDGKFMAHTSSTKRFFRPKPISIVALTPDDMVAETIEIGEYRLNDHGIWHWWPTEKGQAMEKLFGAACS